MKGPRIARRSDGTVIVERFSPARRLEHLFAIATFVALVVTGFPQKFYDTAWAHWLLELLGGLDGVRVVHRVVGLVFAGHLGTHLVVFVVGLLSGRMRPSLVPSIQDLRDAVTNLRYYLGFGTRPADLPKFDYRQKFEYLGLVLGGMVMIVSGLVLYFPRLFVAVLPGEVVPAARVAHSNEALLALVVLAVWHIYGAVLSPEVFPLDRSMVDGWMTAAELEHHHRREWERLFPEEAARQAEERARAAAEAEQARRAVSAPVASPATEPRGLAPRSG